MHPENSLRILPHLDIHTGRCPHGRVFLVGVGWLLWKAWFGTAPCIGCGFGACPEDGAA